MFIDSNNLIPVIQTSKYWILLLLMIVEGPIITYIASFLASLKVFNIYIIFILSSLGNIIGDLILFYLGRSGKIILSKKYLGNINKKIKLHKLEKYLITNPGKAILLIKLIPPLPLPGLILTGSSKIKLKTFLFYSITISILFSLFFTIIGYFSGNAFNILLNYVKNAGIIIGLFIVTLYLLFKLINLIGTKLGYEFLKRKKENSKK